MTGRRIISHAELRAEMLAVARGERSAPPDAGRASFDSVKALADWQRRNHSANAAPWTALEGGRWR